MDLGGANLFSGFGPFGSGPQPEIAKITQLDHVAAAEFLWDKVQQAFEHRHHIGGADSAGVGDLIRDQVQAGPSAGSIPAGPTFYPLILAQLFF